MVQDFKPLHYVYGLASSIYNHHISPIRTLYGILVTFQRRNSLHCKVFDDFSVTPKAFTNLLSYKPQDPTRYPHFFGDTPHAPCCRGNGSTELPPCFYTSQEDLPLLLLDHAHHSLLVGSLTEATD